MLPPAVEAKKQLSEDAEGPVKQDTEGSKELVPDAVNDEGLFLSSQFEISKMDESLFRSSRVLPKVLNIFNVYNVLISISVHHINVFLG